MAYEERNAWAGLIVTVIVMTAYVVVILQQAAGGPLADVVWWPTMLWTIGAGIAGTILLSIVWGIVAGARDQADHEQGMRRCSEELLELRQRLEAWRTQTGILWERILTLTR